MDEVELLTAVPDHPLLHILSFVNYSDLAAYDSHFVIKLALFEKESRSVAGLNYSTQKRSGNTKVNNTSINQSINIRLISK